MQDAGSFVTGCPHFLPYKVVLTALFDCCMHWIHPQGLLSLFFGKNETIDSILGSCLLGGALRDGLIGSRCRATVTFMPECPCPRTPCVVLN